MALRNLKKEKFVERVTYNDLNRCYDVEVSLDGYYYKFSVSTEFVSITGLDGVVRQFLGLLKRSDVHLVVEEQNESP